MKNLKTAFTLPLLGLFLLMASGCGKTSAPAATPPADAKSVVTTDGKPATAPMSREIKPPTAEEAEMLTKIAGTLKAETVDGHFERGQLYLMAGESSKISAAYLEAAKDFTWILEKEPKHPGALSNRGMAYARAGKLELALADFKAGTELNPNDPYPWTVYASVLAKTGKDGEAIKAYDKAVAIGGEAAQAAQFNRGNAHLRMGNKGLAKKDFEKLLTSKNPKIAAGAKMNLDSLK